MYLLNEQRHTRRAFLKRSAHLALAGTATPLAINLAALGEAAAFGATGYKALVCVFLYGGNDYANTVVPFDDAQHALYTQLRGAGAGGALALTKASLGATVLTPTVPLPSGYQYALAPEMAGMATLFAQGRLAVQLNVGPLVVPLTKREYQQAALPQPPKLFSHNDQQSVWQAQGAEGSTRGWGGNIGDLALSANADAMFTCISVTGNAVFLSGQNALQYQCSKAGAVAVDAVRGNSWGQFLYDPAMRDAFAQLIQQPQTHVLANEYSRVTQRSMTAESKVSAAIGGVQLSTPFPAGNSLAEQLQMVARLIGGRTALGAKRQVFMVSLEGFDVHDNMATRQPALLRKLSEALTAFDAALQELGVRDQVTTFTASDFGRSLTLNGDGTDHGWGGHQFVMGGAVNGKAFYGTPPPLSVSNTDAPQDQWHVGQGRLLPSTSVDQYAATLGRWFGVSDSEMSRVLPNLSHFGAGAGRPDYPSDLGFMRA
ncbi:MAG: Tat pathway signal protein [Polaromonas sp.]|nr:Tat pathway signal protein [Polaromonas sp.]